MDTEAVDINGRQVVPGWPCRIKVGLAAATPEQVYDAMRQLLRLPDDDVTLHQLAPMLLKGDGDDWTIPLGVQQLAQLARAQRYGSDQVWVAAGAAICIQPADIPA